ncbi:NADH-quinone oxidoreductase subunit J [Methylophaga nitratireducenticrescens]|uniref:Hydrogenase-4 component B / Formate hydrogenlyase subunit 3 n=1 Tax=Methylophaga nitratireducenticrescens TaxID=754476 RepID=I1XHP4_METNJ|nr:proton-conducting transporter membrane subunit [Methylophaga nitratireducenticrescens]AFI83913.1 NADH-quinone oxidoreductase subunit J [Methylophaga nitratireducenticrescens]
MSFALQSMALPLITALLLLFIHRRAGSIVIITSLLSLAAALAAMYQVHLYGVQQMTLGGWQTPLGIRFQLTPVNSLLLVFTALVHSLVALYAAYSRHSATNTTDFWPLALLLHSSLAALWLSSDLFNWYVTLELLGLAAVAMVTLSGPKAYRPALHYLLLSLVASLSYLLGVALMYGRYGVLDIALLTEVTQVDATTQTALILMTLGLMIKAAVWPFHLWLPSAHANAPTAVSALLSAVVVKGPIYILWLIWTEVAPPELAQSIGFYLALVGIAALIWGGWCAIRTPYLKVLVAYSTVAQLGYATLTLGLLLHWQQKQLLIALWLFVIAHGLAKVSMFLVAGEMQATLGSNRVTALKGATQTMPVAMFAFAVAGGSIIGLPPSGGFVAKWTLLQPILASPLHWPWAIGILLGTFASAVYVFRAVVLSFNRADPIAPDFSPDRFSHWLAMLPALMAWLMASVSAQLIRFLGGVA